MAYNEKVTRNTDKQYRCIREKVRYSKEGQESVMDGRIAEELLWQAVTIIEDGERLSVGIIGSPTLDFRLSDFQEV